MTDYRNWSAGQKAHYIISALSAGEISGETSELIQGWLLSGDNALAKDEELDLLLERLFAESGRPGKRIYELLAQLHKRYGLPEVSLPAGRRISLRRRVWARVAAVVVPLLLVGGIGLVFMDRGGDAVEYVTVQSDAGSFRELSLPDGSTVRIAPGTEFRYADNFIGHRSVKLSGEAFFMVEKMEGNPFTVEAGEMTVTVRGTEFNVKARPGEAETMVSLVSGRVEVKAGEHIRELSPMEQLVYDRGTGEYGIGSFAALQADRWKGRDCALEDVSVREALEMAGEFYGIRMSIDDGLPAGRVIHTTLRSDSFPEDAIYAIQAIAKNFDYALSGDTMTVTVQ